MEATTINRKRELWEAKIQAWNATLSKWVTRITLTYWDDLYRILPSGINWDNRQHRILINTAWCSDKTIDYIMEITERY